MFDYLQQSFIRTIDLIMTIMLLMELEIEVVIVNHYHYLVYFRDLQRNYWLPINLCYY